MLIVTPSDPQASASGAGLLLRWVRSADGQRLDEQGECAPALLPRDEEIVLALPPRQLAWHRVALPRVSGPRLRAALDGLLEDRVLGEVGALHHALEPLGQPGRTLWVCSTDKARLRGWLQALEAANRPAARVAPLLWPAVGTPLPPGAAGVTRDLALALPPTLHWAHTDGQRVWLSTASVLGVSSVLLRPGVAAAVAALHPGTDDPARPAVWLAEPAVAELAEHCLGRRVEPAPEPAWLLRAGRSEWNLAQFDLSLSAAARRTQRWRRAWRQWRRDPAWRPARWGLGALLAAQLVGLNAAAWQEQRALQDKTESVRQTLRDSFPHVALVIDAPVQMRREVQRLQQASGQLAPGDLESLLAGAQQAAGNEPLSATQIGFEPGALRLSAWRADEGTVRALQAGLARAGWRARFEGNELTLQPPAEQTP